MSNYFNELKRAMNFLGQQYNTMFMGQSVLYKGTAIFNTLEGVPDSKRLEMCVAEEMQSGMSLGMALEGLVPISIFPRMDFMMCCMNSLVNHIDKIGIMSQGEYKPKIIIRTALGSIDPLNPGPQHCNDHFLTLVHALKTVEVIKLECAEDIFPAYQYAYCRDDGRSTLLIEISDKLNS